MKLQRFFTAVVLTGIAIAAPGLGQERTTGMPGPMSDETSLCIECHKAYHPGIVEDWLRSRHARTTPKAALLKPLLERRVSASVVPDGLQGVVVGCYECHGLNPSAHRDNFEHFGTKINAVVTPGDCKVCHAVEAEQYGRSKKAHAYGNLARNPVYSLLVNTITAVPSVKKGMVMQPGASQNTKNETCYACHGTEVTVEGTRKVRTTLGDIEVPNLPNMPNHGVGRVNPDGSLGTCSACHSRHGYSIEMARKPYTCAQCHVEPDAPAWNVYTESKHGNLFSGEGRLWNFANVPWTLGRDFRAPTCATCHNSLLVTPEGEVLRHRSHDFGERLWVRIFGLIYTHPQPKDGRTYLIRNGEGLPLPVTFGGEPATGFLISLEEQARRRGAMEKVCAGCHTSGWTARHFDKFARTVGDTDRAIAATTELLRLAWKKGLADKANPFDEKLEQKWLTQWLINGNSVRYSSAMGGPDYATFKNGWWSITKTMEDLRTDVKAKRGTR
jgi:hydroxylamine dehydrogenase